MDQAIRLAIQNHPSIHAATSQVAAASAGVAGARVLRNPEVTLGPAITPNGTDNELYAEQRFELNGTRSARTAAARARLRAAEAARLGAVNSLAAETTLAYWELARAQERVAIERELLTGAEEIERTVRRQVEEGVRPGVDLLQFEVESLKVRRTVREAEAKLESARAILAALIGREGEAVPLPSTIETPPVEVGPIPEAAEQEAMADVLREEAREQAAQGRPDLGVVAVSQSFTREPRTGGIGLVLSLPLIDYGSRRHRTEELRRGETAIRQRAAAIRLRWEADLRKARLRLAAAEDGLRLTQDGILDRSQRLLAASRIGFQAGHTSVVAFLDAQRTARAARLEVVDARAEYAAARTELRRASGGLVPKEGGR